MKIRTSLVFLGFILLIGMTLSCKKEEVPLPDLYVDDISCMGTNLYLTIGNQGEGSLPDNWAGLATLYINGENQEDIVLNLPTSTTRGGIEKPNGLSHYLIPYVISDIARIDVYLDYNNEIKESDENNNEIENVYLNPCALPDLQVNDIYLNEENEIVVVIENIGPGVIPKHVWTIDRQPDCILKVLVDEEEKCLNNMYEFDPEKALEPISGIAVFPTGIILSEESVVTAIIDCDEIMMEKDEENNVKTMVLGGE